MKWIRSPANERSWKTKEVQRLLWDVPSFLGYSAKEDPGGTAEEQTESKEKGWVNAVRRGAQGEKAAAACRADSPAQENTLCVALLDRVNRSLEQ